MLYTIASYSRPLGVHPQTLRRWEREGKPGVTQPTRTPGNHRRYAVTETGVLTVGYARVSCHDQKDDLPRQAERLREHGRAEGKQVEVITDIGRGLNCNKPGLRKLLALLLSGRVRELILAFKDRLLRFGSELIFHVCKLKGVTVTILDTPEAKPPAETFAADVLAILTVFSAKLYGARAHRPKLTPLTP